MLRNYTQRVLIFFKYRTFLSLNPFLSLTQIKQYFSQKKMKQKTENDHKVMQLKQQSNQLFAS